MSVINSESNNQNYSNTNFITNISTNNTNTDNNNIDLKKQKMEQVKQTIKNILNETLKKRIIDLQTKTNEQLLSLKTTSEYYDEFNKKIQSLIKQVEETKKQKDEEKKSHIIKKSISTKKLREKTAPKRLNKTINIIEENTNLTKKFVKWIQIK